MSTRSTTHFIHEGAKKPTAIIYRHSDGYPEGAGIDIRKFLDECEQLNDNRFGDPSYLAAKYVVFLADMFNTVTDWNTGETTRPASKLEFISVGVMDADPGDIEYRYVIACGNGARPKVTCYAVSGTWDREKNRDIPASRWILTEVEIPAEAKA